MLDPSNHSNLSYPRINIREQQRRAAVERHHARLDERLPSLDEMPRVVPKSSAQLEGGIIVAHDDPGASAALGSLCEIVHPNSPESAETTVNPDDPAFSNPSTDSVRLRYRLQDIAKRVMTTPHWQTEEEARRIQQGKLPRICNCQRTVINSNSNTGKDNPNGQVAVYKSGKGSAGHYGNLQTCGSVWICAVCGAKITERRAEEVSVACRTWAAEAPGGCTVMVSTTIPHYHDDSLADLRYHLMYARRRMKDQKPLKRQPGFNCYQDILARYGIEGSVTAIEVTYGQNGWHPHSHELYFSNRTLSDGELQELEADLTTAWIRAVDKRGKLLDRFRGEDVRDGLDKRQRILQDMQEHSVDVRRAKSAADYISKMGFVDYDLHKDLLHGGWGFAQELTKAHLKKSRRKGMSPWDLLRMIDANPGDRQVWGRCAYLFREYADVFQGKAQLFWSKGFKARLGIAEVSDEEIAAETDSNPSEVIGHLDADEWAVVRKNKLRARVLILAQLKPFEYIKNYINAYTLPDGKSRGKPHEKSRERET